MAVIIECADGMKHLFYLSNRDHHVFSYVPPPPSRPRYNQFNDIETNQISNDIDPYSNAKYNPYAPPNPKGFFLDVSIIKFNAIDDL